MHHPSAYLNAAQVVYQPNYQIISQVPLDQSITAQLMNQYCALAPMVIQTQYIQPNLLASAVQNQGISLQQLQLQQQQQQLQLQQQQQQQQQQLLQQQQQQQYWIQNGLILNQFPQVASIPVIISQKCDNEEFAENEDSLSYKQRTKQCSESFSTLMLNNNNSFNQIDIPSIESSRFNQNQQISNNQNSSPATSQYQFSASALQQATSQWNNPFESREVEVGKFINQVKSSGNNNQYSHQQNQVNEKSNQLKIVSSELLRESSTYNNNNNNSSSNNCISTPTTSISYKLIQNPPSISASLSTTLSAHDSGQQLPKIKKEVILDSEEDDSDMNLEDDLLSSECQQEFSLTSVQLNKDLEDAFKSMQETPFYQNSDLIFTPQYGKQFKLKQSMCKNDEIVFSKIKEYRKNRRHLNNSKDAENLANPCKVNSKFHNLNKLFMYKLLATFSQKNLVELDVPSYLHGILLKLIMRLKQSTKEMKNYNKKTEFFSHDHYNLLFLHLNERTVKYLVHSPFSIYLHKLCFNLDLNQVDQNNSSAFIKCNNEKIQYINIIKRFCCQIVQNSNMLGVYQDSSLSHDDGQKSNQNNEDSDFEGSNLNDSSESGNKSGRKSPKSSQSKSGEKQISEQQQSHRQNMRQAYTQRALKGILSLNQGVIIRRF